jgi:ArsR family metal-binding transcriptional regulator
MRFNREKVLATLRAINDKVMAKHGSPASNQEAYPTIKRVFTEAAPKVEGIQAVLDSGLLDKVTAVTDEAKAKAIEEELTQEIRSAIRRGELPPPDTDPFVKKWKKRKKK